MPDKKRSGEGRQNPYGTKPADALRDPKAIDDASAHPPQNETMTDMHSETMPPLSLPHNRAPGEHASIDASSAKS